MYGGVLSPHGAVAHQELGLIVQATWLMLIVVVPVLALLFFFAWRYRAGGTGAYVPNWEHSKIDELIWWAIPLEIVLVLGALAWQSTYALDPHKPLLSDVRPLTVEVVALPSKWLFIYPALGIASVNELTIPVNTPINFQITADAPMNSFFIPELGGQIYAMTGMVNPLNLSAEAEGDYQGFSANYSGEGFAQMRFVVHARAQKEFDAWVSKIKTDKNSLTMNSYRALKQPGALSQWGAVEPNLFERIVQQFIQ